MGSKSVVTWAYFPRNQKIPAMGQDIVKCFDAIGSIVDSKKNNDQIGIGFKDAISDAVLAHVRPGLESLGFQVEKGKKAGLKISVPVLFGRDGVPTQTFEADALHESMKWVIEVEAGRAVTNYQFLKDLFQASVMVDVDYLCIAVRQVYKRSKDFEKVYSFLDTLYASGRLQLPLKGVLVVGY